jgi:hypothetical protein
MTESDGERQALADRLRGLPIPELVDVLRRVLPAHDDNEGRNGLTTRLVLAEATTYDETVPRTADDPPVTLEVVAWPDRDYYDGGFGPESELFEQGHCVRCDVEVTSTAKQAFCAICGTLCELT